MANSDSDNPPKESRIQRANREKIIKAATDIFAKYGFRGATLDQIAKSANMSKPNLIYYYSSKDELYLVVLKHILDVWLRPLKELNVDEDPEVALTEYIDQKFEFSKLYPSASRVFANEMTAGAPVLKPILETYVRDVVKKKASVIRKWVKLGSIANVDPYHLIITIWAITQHYADFSVQIESVTGSTLQDKTFYNKTRKNIRQIILHGIKR